MKKTNRKTFYHNRFKIVEPRDFNGPKRNNVIYLSKIKNNAPGSKVARLGACFLALYALIMVAYITYATTHAWGLI